MLPVLFASNNFFHVDTLSQCLAPSLRALLSDLGWGFLNLACSPLLIRCLFALSKSCSLAGHSKFYFRFVRPNLVLDPCFPPPCMLHCLQRFFLFAFKLAASFGRFRCSVCLQAQICVVLSCVLSISLK
jgi:hypothetical protein